MNAIIYSLISYVMNHGNSGHEASHAADHDALTTFPNAESLVSNANILMK